MNFRRSIFPLIFAAVFLASGGTSAFAASPWTSVRSQHFKIVGEASETEVRSLAMRLEQFRDVFEQLGTGLKVDAGGPLTVLVFQNARSYAAFKPKRPDGTSDDAVAGFLLPADDVNYITLSLDAARSDPYQTICHEYVHYLLRANLGKKGLPTWLDEGLAQYFETLGVAGDTTVTVGAAPRGRLHTLKGSALIPASEFFAADRLSLARGSDARRELFYAQAWSLVRYLLENGRSAPDLHLDRLFEFADNKTKAAAFEHAFGTETTILNDKFKHFIDGHPAHATILPLSKRSNSQIALTSKSVSQAEADAYLGDLLLRWNRSSEAEIYLRRAVAAEPSSPMANGSLGLLLIRQNNFAEATEHLRSAAADENPNYLILFSYAYALSRVAEDKNGDIAAFSPATFEQMRDLLQRSAALAPQFVDNYRLLAFIGLVQDKDLNEAETLLRKGLTITPGNEQLEILLAKILLRQERFDEAKVVAARLGNSAEPQIRSDAADGMHTVEQYSQARLRVSVDSGIRLAWAAPLLLLKRSWVTESDIAAIERDRDMFNLNIALGHRRADESQAVGVIRNVACTGAAIEYTVESDGNRFLLSGKDFQSVRMGVVIEGSHDFRLDCGVDLSKNKVVVDYIPAGSASQKNGVLGQLTSVTFVPDNFELKTPEQMASARMVVVEDDQPGGNHPDPLIPVVLKAESSKARWASISQSLRLPRDGEKRVVGTLTKIDCGSDMVSITASAADKSWDLTSRTPAEIKVAWFSSESTQVPLVCGSQPGAANTLFTFNPGAGNRGELKAIEFLPAGFPAPTSKELAQ